MERAQDDGAPPFDIVLCDEAHRTTGIERPGDQTSPFVLVHDAERTRAAKRLYMTATPRLYTEGARAKAASHNVEVFSWTTRRPTGRVSSPALSRSVEQNLLSDYKVVVLAMSEQHVDAALQGHLASGGGEIISPTRPRSSAAGARCKIRRTSARAMAGQPLGRAIAFTNTIRSSKLLEAHWDGIVRQAVALLPEEERPDAFHCETRHVDGQHHALDRKARIEWLKDDPKGPAASSRMRGACRKGSTCPRSTPTVHEPAQQPGRYRAGGRPRMRKAPGKVYGYIVLPVAVPAGVDPAGALDDNERFAAVWSVLRALRSHDDRFDAEINKIDLNDRPTDRIIFSGDGIAGDNLPSAPELAFRRSICRPARSSPRSSRSAATANTGRPGPGMWRISFRASFTGSKGCSTIPTTRPCREWFEAFHEELKVSINESITTDSAIDMMAQHILTRPVFEALFEQYDFAGGNPVAQALDALRKDFGEFGLENEPAIWSASTRASGSGRAASTTAKRASAC